MLEKKAILTTGKAKSLFTTSDESKLIMEYRDDTSAFDGKKIEKLAGKGTDQQQIQCLYNETS
jgi:phosphoribosylaminoimidazole-succinocarboxamide synthase